MKLWNTIKSLFSKLPEADCCPSTEVATEVEEEMSQASCVELFVEVCTEHGVGKALLERIGAIEKFEQWYDGDCNKEAILRALPDFKIAHAQINAKLNGKL